MAERNGAGGGPLDRPAMPQEEAEITPPYRFQRQQRPGLEERTEVRPRYRAPNYRGSRGPTSPSSTCPRNGATPTRPGRRSRRRGAPVCNIVSPGPTWTVPNLAGQRFTDDYLTNLGSSSAMGRVAQPEEVAPAYVYLASDADSSFTVGEVIAVTGGLTDTR
ncbi:SDR family oxidoreductase [Streptomyces mutabilis]|uniref:SDR family oxidoreductase n=1 Tax=Streptomyces mutabilis TaxID=67332 RepID=UPI0034DF3238